MRIADCVLQNDVKPIQDILNEVIAHSTALYDYQPRDLHTVTTWAQQKRDQDWPLRGAYDRDGRLMGFATFGPFRPQPAYKYTVEHSIYIDPAHRGKGVAAALLQNLIDEANNRDLHVMIGCIDAANTASIRLHEKLGFTSCGTIVEAAFKFGRWLDATFYQKRLSTPAHPVDG